MYRMYKCAKNVFLCKKKSFIIIIISCSNGGSSSIVVIVIKKRLNHFIVYDTILFKAVIRDISKHSTQTKNFLQNFWYVDLHVLVL